MEFENRLKGYVVETVIESLLSDSGYTVLRTGIEKRILEPAAKQGIDGWIGVPEHISKMPDFLVIENKNEHRALFVEIKYRQDWATCRAELANRLLHQLRIFQRVMVIVCVGQAQTGSNGPRGTKHSWPIDHIKVLQAVLQDDVVCHEAASTIPLLQCAWNKLSKLQEAFPKLEERKDKKTMIKAANLIAALEVSIDNIASEDAA